MTGERLGCSHHGNNYWPAVRGCQEEIMNKASGPVSRCLLGKIAKMPTISLYQIVIPHMVKTEKGQILTPQDY